MHVFLDFEKPIADLEGKIEELRQLKVQGETAEGGKPKVDIDEDIARLRSVRRAQHAGEVQLVNDARRAAVADLEPALQQGDGALLVRDELLRARPVPLGLALRPADGALVVTDTFNDRVRLLTPR